jgi:hypothetical protein
MRKWLFPKAEGRKFLVLVNRNEIDDVGLLLSKAAGF